MSLSSIFLVISSMNSYIPEELWPEILCKLPVKSLLRFRCVSKSWKLMIDDPDFCRLHLNSFENNSQQTHLIFMMREEFGLGCVVKCAETMETTARLGTLLRHEGPSRAVTDFDTVGYPGEWSTVGMMDGLFLLHECGSLQLMLWNPSIKKFRIIPPSPKIPEGTRNVNMGLGFDPSTKDYKIAKLVVHSDYNSVHSVSVYSVMTGLWKTVEFRGKGYADWHWALERVGPLGFRAFCFRGYLCLIWDYFGLGTVELVSFDLSNEVFVATTLPHYEDEEEPEDIFKGEVIVLNDECLLVRYDSETTDGEIWALESGGTGFESMHWKKRSAFYTDMPDLYYFFVLKNGDLLLRNMAMVVRVYMETQEVKMLLIEPETVPDIVQIYQYKESLLLLE